MSVKETFVWFVSPTQQRKKLKFENSPFSNDCPWFGLKNLNMEYNIDVHCSCQTFLTAETKMGSKANKGTKRAFAQRESEAALCNHMAPAVAEVRVKTLEDIRREMAARLQAQRVWHWRAKNEEVLLSSVNQSALGFFVLLCCHSLTEIHAELIFQHKRHSWVATSETHINHLAYEFICGPEVAILGVKKHIDHHALNSKTLAKDTGTDAFVLILEKWY